MKSLFTLLLLNLTLIATSVKANEVNWHTDYKAAQALAKKENKNILMYFTGSDWCAPCKMLKTDFFETERFVELAQNYVLVKVDIPRRVDIISKEQLSYNLELLSQFNTEKVFPKMIFLSHRGKNLDEVEGYNSLRDPRIYFEKMEENIR